MHGWRPGRRSSTRPRLAAAREAGGQGWRVRAAPDHGRQPHARVGAMAGGLCEKPRRRWSELENQEERDKMRSSPGRWRGRGEPGARVGRLKTTRSRRCPARPSLYPAAAVPSAAALPSRHRAQPSRPGHCRAQPTFFPATAARSRRDPAAAVCRRHGPAAAVPSRRGPAAHCRPAWPDRGRRLADSPSLGFTAAMPGPAAAAAKRKGGEKQGRGLGRRERDWAIG